MPKIPLIQSQRSLPGNAGNAFVQDRSGEIIGNALQQFGDTLRVAEEKHSEKKAKVASFEAENALMEFSRQEYTTALTEKLGKLALPDEESGYAGVYEDYNKSAEDFISKQIGKIDPRYQEAAKQRLVGVADRYRDRFMAHQATQLGEYRKETLKANIALTEDEMKMAVASGVGLEAVDTAYQQIEELTKAEARGGNTQEFLEQKKASLYESAIVATAASHPEIAKQMLDDKRSLKVLDPAVKERLDSTVEKALVDKAVNTTINSILNADISWEGRNELWKDLPRTTPEEREISDQVAREIDYAKSREEKERTSTQYELFNSTYESIVDDNNPPTPKQIDSDPQFEVLEPSQREALKRMVEDPEGEAGKFEGNERLRLWGQTRGKIIGLKMNPKQVMTAALNGEFDFRDAKELVKLAEGIVQNPQLKMGDDLLRRDYPKVWKNSEKKWAALSTIRDSMEDYQKRNNALPYGQALQDIVDFAAKDSIRDTFVGIPLGKIAPFELEAGDERAKYSTKIIEGFVSLGFDDAVFNEATGDIQLEVRDDGAVLILPAGKTSLKDAQWWKPKGTK